MIYFQWKRHFRFGAHIVLCKLKRAQIFLPAQMHAHLPTDKIDETPQLNV